MPLLDDPRTALSDSERTTPENWREAERVADRFNIPLLDADPCVLLGREDDAAEILVRAMRVQLRTLMAYVPEGGWDSPVDIAALRRSAQKCGVSWHPEKEDRLSCFLLDGFSGVYPQEDSQSVERQLLWQDWSVRLNYLLRFPRGRSAEKPDWRYELAYMQAGPPDVTMQQSCVAFWKRYEALLCADPAELLSLGVPAPFVAEKTGGKVYVDVQGFGEDGHSWVTGKVITGTDDAERSTPILLVPKVPVRG